MNSEEFEALLRAEVEEARSHYERAKRALEAYLGESSAPDMRRTKFPDQQPSSIAVEVRKIVSQFEPGHIFTAEDLFIEMDNENLVYSKARPSISAALSRLVEEKKLEKTTRRSFKKPTRAGALLNMLEELK